MANPNRGELEIYIGGQTRTVRFRVMETSLLQKRLDCDPIAYMAKSGGVENFLMEALFCGMQKTEKKVTPMRVATWLDDDTHPIKVNNTEVDRQTLMREIVYVIARGKSPKEADEQVKLLDEVFEEAGLDPLPSASSVTTSTTPASTKASSSQPQSA